MMKMAVSPAASAVLRALISRSAVERNRFLLIGVQSTDWQSLTFTGERHRMTVRISGEDAGKVADRLCGGIEDAELSGSGVIIADISVEARRDDQDGSVELTFEALTLADD